MSKIKKAIDAFIEVITSDGECVTVPRGGVAYDSFGREVLDPTPLEMPLHFSRPPTIQETIRQVMRSERFAQDISAAGYDTPEEADDFFDENDDDYSDQPTSYEHDFDHLSDRSDAVTDFDDEVPVSKPAGGAAGAPPKAGDEGAAPAPPASAK